MAVGSSGKFFARIHNCASVVLRTATASRLLDARLIASRLSRATAASPSFITSTARLFHASAPRRAQDPVDQPVNAESQEKPVAPDPKDAEIERLKAEATTAKTNLAYALAQVQNVQRSAKADYEKAVKFGIQDFVKDVLDVADNLERCLANFPKDLLLGNKPLHDFHQGVSMTQSVLFKVLGKHGVERLHPLGLKFDTATMNALMRLRDPSKLPGTVGLVTKPGYTLRGRVIRAADVAVVEPEPSKSDDQPAAAVEVAS